MTTKLYFMTKLCFMIKYTYKITVKGRDLKGTVGSLSRFP